VGRLAALPARLDAAAVTAVLAACDRATVTGRRDYAVLILLARLGLRAHEVAGLELDDIRWRAGTVVLRRKGGRSEELPLPADAGQALADYLLIRPAVSGSRAVFISAAAPRRPLTRSAVTLLARRHCAAAGIGSGGAHRLRHTLASDLLAAGASLAEIGLVLGHRSPFVTSIYAREGRPSRPGSARPPMAADRNAGEPMSMMRQAAQRYLQLRRSLGYELDEPGRLLLDFADHLDALGVTHLPIDAVVTWATAPQDATAYWHWLRLSAVRGLAVHPPTPHP